ncbi:androgen-induced gene 1 protein isoform 3-T3 [Thomomys bottae]
MALVPCQVLRVAILLSYCSILCNYKAIEMPSHQTYGGSWKFLTFIDLRPGLLCPSGAFQNTCHHVNLQHLKEVALSGVAWSFA